MVFFLYRRNEKMSKQKYLKHQVKLTTEEQAKLAQIVSTGKASAQTIIRANVLLASNENRDQGKLSAKKIAEMYHLHQQTVHDIRKQFCLQGLEKTITRKKRETPPPPKVTGDVEAKIIALACSQPPDGRTEWTLRLLADRSVELEYIDSISHQSIYRLLKKTYSSLTSKNVGVSHPSETRNS
jgi:transposase